MDKYIGFDTDSKKTAARLIQKGEKADTKILQQIL